MLIKLTTKKRYFSFFTFEEIKMSTLDCPYIACIELFTARQYLILH